MGEIYRSAEIPSSVEGAPIAVHCSDPRYQPHFQDFLRKGLSLAHYAPIVVPGGPHLLAPLDFLPKFNWVGWRWTKFMVDLTRAERVILIVHDDCRWYLQSVFQHDRARVHERMVEDARRVRANLLERFGPRKIDIYYARLVGNRASFDTVT
jgi:hypothetical protein